MKQMTIDTRYHVVTLAGRGFQVGAIQKRNRRKESWSKTSLCKLIKKF